MNKYILESISCAKQDNIGFPPEAVKELRVIEATEEINRVRAVIVL